MTDSKKDESGVPTWIFGVALSVAGALIVWGLISWAVSSYKEHSAEVKVEKIEAAKKPKALRTKPMKLILDPLERPRITIDRGDIDTFYYTPFILVPPGRSAEWIKWPDDIEDDKASYRWEDSKYPPGRFHMWRLKNVPDRNFELTIQITPNKSK